MQIIGIWRQNTSEGTSVLWQIAIKCFEKYHASQWHQKDGVHSTWEGAPQLLKLHFSSALNLW